MRPAICRWVQRPPTLARLSAEQALEEKLIATLGAGHRRGQRARLGDSGLQSGGDRGDQESYDPDQTVTLSMQRTEQTTGAQPVAAGVPGTASNAPNSQAVAGLSAADHSAADRQERVWNLRRPRRPCGMWLRIRAGAAADRGHRGERPAGPGRRARAMRRSGSLARPMSCAT
jgi:hypothetical protein